MEPALSAAPVERLVRLPLRFTDENIAAIRLGRKTQTRRPIKPKIRSPYDEDSPYRKDSGNWFWHHDYEYDRYLWRKPKYEVGEVVAIADKDGNEAGLSVMIEAVTPERLQEITEGGANAEGLPHTLADFHLGSVRRNWFIGLWSSIYGPENEFAWERNPWVWVYQFRVME